jgi:hypothetical protein
MNFKDYGKIACILLISQPPGMYISDVLGHLRLGVITSIVIMIALLFPFGYLTITVDKDGWLKFRPIMKIKYITIYLLMVVYLIYEFIKYDDWNFFLLLMLPFALGGIYILSVSFISGGNGEFVKKFPMPKFFIDALTQLGASFRQDLSFLYLK